MPGLTTVVPTRRRRTIEDDEENEGSLVGVGTPASVQSASSKRARLESEDGSESANDVLPDSYRAEPRQRPTPHSAGMNGVNGANGGGNHDHNTFQPGSILRVKMTNFVTYTCAEYLLGPSLNMIIGPNGTGKSTLVCAICIGLGADPSNLGRAKQVGEFVKHGSREGEIEIELQAKPQQSRNPVIRVVIKKDGNKRAWSINEKTVKHLDIKALIKSYSIQIDNLCQFLPQDRVVEFASLTSEQLLEQTQQAAAPDYMAQWHGDLKRLDKEKREKDHNQRLWKDQLGNDQTRQQHDQHTVDRMKERSELVEQLSAYKKFRLVVDYTEARAKCNEAKARSRAAEAEAKVVREELEPALQALNNKQGYRDKVDRVVTQKRKMVDRSELFADQTKKKHEALDTKISGFEAEEQAEKELITRTIGDERRTEGKIRNLKSQMEQAPPAFDAREYNETIREKNREMQELENQAGDVQSNMRDINQRAVDQKNIKTRANNDIDHFKSQVGQQMRLLAQLSGDSAKAWEWLQNNQDKFKEPVYGPPAVECSIADRAYATAVESVFRGNDFCIFTCTNRDDFATLSNYLTGKDHLNLSDVSIRSCTTPLQNFQKPVTNEQLALYGLDGWIIDYLKGPEAVLSMLCENMKLHKTGVTLKSHSNAQYEVLENSPITSWVAGQESITITRRQEYNAHSASVRKIRNGKVWSGQSVDMDGDREMRRQRDEASDAISALEEEMDKLKADLKTLQSRHRETKAEKDRLEKEKAAKQKVQSDFAQLPVKLDGLEYELNTAKNARKEAWNSVEMLRKQHAELFEHELWLIEADSDLDVLQHQSAEAQATLKNLEKELASLKEEIKRRKEEAIVKREAATKMIAETSPEEGAIQQQLSKEITLSELEGEISALSARLEVMSEGDPGVLKQYQDRAKRIEKLEKMLEKVDAETEDLTQKITGIREKWEPELDNLVAKISEAFSYHFTKIGCAGEVEVDKAEQFENWSIKIRVRFRENEELSVLNSQRQSGGERAVSTIFYLMALQSLSRAPFRVVDEINQGMDPRNERVVHERMVEIACEEATSQYFLITPKLLRDLVYHPRMKTHIIESGEYMPAGQMDIGKIIEAARQVKGMA